MAQSSLAAEARGNKGFALQHFETLRVFLICALPLTASRGSLPAAPVADPIVCHRPPGQLRRPGLLEDAAGRAPDYLGPDKRLSGSVSAGPRQAPQWQPVLVSRDIKFICFPDLPMYTQTCRMQPGFCVPLPPASWANNGRVLNRMGRRTC